MGTLAPCRDAHSAFLEKGEGGRPDHPEPRPGLNLSVHASAHLVPPSRSHFTTSLDVVPGADYTPVISRPWPKQTLLRRGAVVIGRFEVVGC